MLRLILQQGIGFLNEKSFCMTTIIRPNEQRGRWAKSALWAIFALSAGKMILDYGLYLTYPTSDFSISSKLNSLTGVLKLLTLMEVLTAIAEILAPIFFIMWFRRAYYNIGQLAGPMNHSDGWVSGYWFLPLLNLYKPYQLMREMHLKTRAFLQEISQLPTQFHLKFLGFWWAFWIIVNLVNYVSQKFWEDATTLEVIKGAFFFEAIGCLVNLIAVLLAINVVQTYRIAEPILATYAQENVADLPPELEAP